MSPSNFLKMAIRAHHIPIAMHLRRECFVPDARSKTNVDCLRTVGGARQRVVRCGIDDDAIRSQPAGLDLQLRHGIRLGLL